MICKILPKNLLAIAAILCPAVTWAETFTVSTALQPKHWGSTHGAEPFMACVKQATKNQIDFTYYPSGQLAKFNQSLSAVNNKLAQISYIVIVTESAKLPLNGIPTLPDMGDTVVQMTNAYRKVLRSGGPLAKEYAANRVVPLLINMFPAYQLVSRSGPMDQLEKIKGKKISAGGESILVTTKALGAIPVEMSTVDAYMGLQNGTVDGAMQSLAAVKPYHFQEVSKAINANGSFGGAAGVWVIDRGIWDGLSPENQKTMSDCGLKIEAELAQWADKWAEELKVELVAAG
ncbi:TRAP transporter substrate-binding protein DctP [Noviherbaspirillum sedimenti]|uniref:C4-dicarboxylate ABC transporter substrate-binding protein n=1 Tax=Noviherbaspirillum sedimenti TaxID=2320865 RepID=A0A3A3G9L3_9BURK|nr:TRAP transporter substrate-binding protein DctP [Noviherbaspirillum sedimenti]RJG03272.1 C4-dicarboxylate ABC transporter substrate-binding protein [Noviherbaspirillum sedimenti]